MILLRKAMDEQTPNRMPSQGILFYIFLVSVRRLLLLLVIALLLLLVRGLLLIIRLGERNAAAALPEEQVQQGAEHNPGRHEPDNGQPEDLARHRVIIFQDHKRSKDMPEDRHENNH
jgi:hypothetical protein